MVLAMDKLTDKEKYDAAYAQAIFLKDRGYFSECNLLELTELLLSKPTIPEFGVNWS